VSELASGLKPVSVLIAAAHAATRAKVRLALEGRGFSVCGEVADASSAVQAALAKRPDVCLVDVNLPGNGIHATSSITSELPATAVVMLTRSEKTHGLFAAFRAGACGYLVKDIDADRLPLALLGVFAGEPTLPAKLIERVLEEFHELGPRRRVPAGVELTDREYEVLKLLHDGLTTADVADRLFISRVTVRCHVASVLKKLQVTTREAAMRVLD
jgi:DNA-binding NarL/FixJ family response regulator